MSRMDVKKGPYTTWMVIGQFIIFCFSVIGSSVFFWFPLEAGGLLAMVACLITAEQICKRWGPDKDNWGKILALFVAMYLVDGIVLILVGILLTPFFG